MSKFDELKKLAEAATKGLWRKGSGFTIGPVSKEDDQSYGMVIPLADVYGDNREADIDYIAAANPAAILELFAIQAQQIKILKSITSAIRDGLHIEYGSIIYHEAIDALAAAEAQP